MVLRTVHTFFGVMNFLHSAIRTVLFLVVCKYVEGFAGLSDTEQFNTLLPVRTRKLLLHLISTATLH